MKVIIDRFENDQAIVEIEKGEFVAIVGALDAVEPVPDVIAPHSSPVATQAVHALVVKKECFQQTERQIRRFWRQLQVLHRHLS